VTVWAELEDELAPTPITTIVRLSCEKLSFHTASPVVLPPGLLVLRDVLTYAKGKQDEGDERLLLITAHTDTVDADAKNQALSDRRALSVRLLLEFKRREWAELCAEHFRPKDVKDVLRWAAVCWLWKCHPERDPNPVVAFKTGYEGKFQITLSDKSAATNASFWACVFGLYQHRLYKDLLGVDAKQKENPYHAALKWLDPEHPSIGCGERHLLVHTADEVSEVRNRRIEILFLTPEQKPEEGSEEIEGHPAHLEAVYDARRYKFYDLPCPKPVYHDHELHAGNVVFVLDVSTSMQGVRIERARRELIGAIQALDESFNFAVVTFALEAETVWWTGPTRKIDSERTDERSAADFERGAKAQLKKATQKNCDDAIARVSEIPLDAATNTRAGMLAALDATGLRTIDADLGEQNTLELLSDGSPTPRFMKGGVEVERGTPGARRQTVNTECARVLQETTQANTAGWVINTTGFFAKWEYDSARRRKTRWDPSGDPTYKMMDNLRKAGPQEGAFTTIRMGTRRKPQPRR
jgi:hypothetical protein